MKIISNSLYIICTLYAIYLCQDQLYRTMTISIIAISKISKYALGMQMWLLYPRIQFIKILGSKDQLKAQAFETTVYQTFRIYIFLIILTCFKGQNGRGHNFYLSRDETYMSPSPIRVCTWTCIGVLHYAKATKSTRGLYECCE